MKKTIAICLLAVIAATGFGCGKKDPDADVSRETIDINQTKQELTFNYKTGTASDATEAEDPNADPVESAADASAAEPETQTVIEVVTEYVPVTDDKGQDVTDAEGAKTTEAVVKETREVVVPVTEKPGDNSQSNQPSNYTPAYDTCKAYWLDMSQMGDYTFNGEFLVINFKVNDNVPDGNYPVSISMTDIASWDLVKYEPEKINGEVAINTDVSSQADMSSSDFTLKINSVAAKQGDNATVTVDLANNPGFCGFVIDIEYDTNALTIINAKAGKDFDAAVNVVK
jgi:hypothetical protein